MTFFLGQREAIIFPKKVKCATYHGASEPSGVFGKKCTFQMFSQKYKVYKKFQ
jgi:hypothetical protein